MKQVDEMPTSWQFVAVWQCHDGDLDSAILKYGDTGSLLTLKAAVAVVATPVAVAADIVTLGGSLTDREEPYTAEQVSNVVKNLENAAKPRK